jgi:hypothetical protein
VALPAVVIFAIRVATDDDLAAAPTYVKGLAARK